MKTDKETEVSANVTRGVQEASAEMMYVSEVSPLNRSP